MKLENGEIIFSGKNPDLQRLAIAERVMALWRRKQSRKAPLRTVLKPATEAYFAPPPTAGSTPPSVHLLSTATNRLRQLEQMRPSVVPGAEDTYAAAHMLLEACLSPTATKTQVQRNLKRVARLTPMLFGFADPHRKPA